MKRINFTTLLVSIFLVIVLTESCKKDEICVTINCNTGILDEETCTCDCPIGFSGANCDVEDLCITQNLECQNGGICLAGTCDCPDGFYGIFCETKTIQHRLEIETPLQIFDSNVPLDSLYGKIYQGGFIFYLNTTNGTGMVAATENQSEGDGALWGCSGIEINGADGMAIGTGAENTLDIESNCMEMGIAARLCSELNLNGKDDWFLPSKEELTLMYTNLQAKGYGDFNPDLYLSSTQSGYLLVWAVRFDDDLQYTIHKNNDKPVRAARAF